VTASSAVVLSNLAYLMGAVVLATIGGLIVWWRHRQPQSIYSNVEAFHRGLQALAPDAKHGGSNGIRPAVSGLRIQPEPVAPAATDAVGDPTADRTGPAVAIDPGTLPGPVNAPTIELEPVAVPPVATNGNGSHHPPDPEPAAADLNGGIPDLLDGVMGSRPVSLGRLEGAMDVPPVAPGPPEPAFPLTIDEAGTESRVAGRAGVEAG
jgi:hypothetical protein